MRIYKYQFPGPGDVVEINMPLGALCLTVQVQREQPCIWAMINETEKRTEIKKFMVAGTGHDLTFPPGESRYIGTFQLVGGSLVYHVFELARGETCDR